MRQYLQRKPPSSKTNPSGHLCSTYPFYLAPLCLHLSSSPLHLITPSISLSPFSPQASVSVSIHLYRFLPTNPHPHLHSCSVLYWAATAWVSPPEVTSSMRLPEDGRFTPVAQLKNILRRKKKKWKNFLSSWIKSPTPFHVNSYILYVYNVLNLPVVVLSKCVCFFLFICWSQGGRDVSGRWATPQSYSPDCFIRCWQRRFTLAFPLVGWFFSLGDILLYDCKFTA